MTKLSRLIVFLILLIGAILLAAVLDIWHIGLNWHDQQRLYQVFILIVVSSICIFSSPLSLPRNAFIALLVIFSLGLLSTLLAQYPLWAAKEWARYIGLLLLVLFVARVVQEQHATRTLLYVLATVSFFNAFQFLVAYISAIISDLYIFDADVLFNGFSNPRFLNQFQMLLMPMLAYLSLTHWKNIGRYQRPLAALFFSILIVHWCIAFTLGGRGLWLGLAVSHLAMLLFSPRFWRLLAIQAAAAVIGFVLFYSLFVFIPNLLELDPTLRDSLRVGLSKRDVIWQQAWSLFLQNPVLGVGPMHFSAYPNGVAAHPHQVVLQWLAEWGLIATLLATSIASWGMWHGLQYLRAKSAISNSAKAVAQANAQPLDAALWISIAGALVLAQVDGVFVMPYTETWLAILIGIALGRWSTHPQPMSFTQHLTVRLLALPVILVFGYLLLYEAPNIADDIQNHIETYHTGYAPRFWSQGWIPMDGK